MAKKPRIQEFFYFCNKNDIRKNLDRYIVNTIMNLLSEIIINENKNNIDKGVYKVDSEAIEKVEKIEDIKLEKEDNKNYNKELEIVESNIDNNNINEIVKKSVDKGIENVEEKLQNDQTIILKSINDIEECNDDTIGGQLVTGLKNNLKNKVFPFFYEVHR